ncbi:hypothetical protein [Clostridium sp.]|uniref:hypothetical protein n=1 Tax=Clostridium sp. TaxID=1506 RepID=UPI003217AF6F
MIYKKDANFPYPILTNVSNSYENCEFILDIDLNENVEDYRFEINCEITSNFINMRLVKGQAQLILVIQSKDNKFFNVGVDDKFICIPKSRISMSKRTIIQMLIQAKEEISFKDNSDLSSFYDQYRQEIKVDANSILGFSNTVLFDGSNAKPLEIFEKRVDPNIKSDIKIEIGSETIVLVYKNESFQFNDSQKSNILNNPYVYMGLQKALFRFITNNSEDISEEVNLDEIDPPTDGLDFKLYNLMRSKMISELSIENIDEVIYSISDKILGKYTETVRSLYKDAN